MIKTKKFITLILSLILSISLSSAYYGYQDPIQHLTEKHNPSHYDYIVVEKKIYSDINDYSYYNNGYNSRSFRDYPTYSSLRSQNNNRINYNYYRDYDYGNYPVYDSNYRFEDTYDSKYYSQNNSYTNPYYYSPRYDWHLDIYNWRY